MPQKRRGGRADGAVVMPTTQQVAAAAAAVATAGGGTTGGQNVARKKRHAESQAKHYAKKKAMMERLREENRELANFMKRVIQELPDAVRPQLEQEARAKFPNSFSADAGAKSTPLKAVAVAPPEAKADAIASMETTAGVEAPPTTSI